MDAVSYALAYHRGLAELADDLGVPLCARAGLHLGEVFLRPNDPDDVARGAKPLEVEGLAKATAARLMSLARGGQTLLTRGAFDLARRATVGAGTPAAQRPRDRRTPAEPRRAAGGAAGRAAGARGGAQGAASA